MLGCFRMPLSVDIVVPGRKSNFYWTLFMHGMKCQSDCAAMGDGPYCKFFMYCMKFQLDHAAMCNDLTYEKLNRGQCLIPQADCIEPQSKE